MGSGGPPDAPGPSAEQSHLWAGGRASPRTPAGPITALTLEGCQSACDAKTKDQHSPGLGQTLPKPPACCPVEGHSLPSAKKTKQKNVLNTALPTQRAGCTDFSICSQEASCGRQADRASPGAVLEWPGLANRGSLSFQQVASLRHQVSERGYCHPPQVVRLNHSREEGKRKNKQSVPKRRLFVNRGHKQSCNESFNTSLIQGHHLKRVHRTKTFSLCFLKCCDAGPLCLQGCVCRPFLPCRIVPGSPAGLPSLGSEAHGHQARSPISRGTHTCPEACCVFPSETLCLGAEGGRENGRRGPRFLFCPF